MVCLIQLTVMASDINICFGRNATIDGLWQLMYCQSLTDSVNTTNALYVYASRWYMLRKGIVRWVLIWLTMWLLLKQLVLFSKLFIDGEAESQVIMFDRLRYSPLKWKLICSLARLSVCCLRTYKIGQNKHHGLYIDRHDNYCWVNGVLLYWVVCDHITNCCRRCVLVDIWLP